MSNILSHSLFYDPSVMPMKLTNFLVFTQLHFDTISEIGVFSKFVTSEQWPDL